MQVRASPQLSTAKQVDAGTCGATGNGEQPSGVDRAARHAAAAGEPALAMRHCRETRPDHGNEAAKSAKRRPFQPFRFGFALFW